MCVYKQRGVEGIRIVALTMPPIAFTRPLLQPPAPHRLTWRARMRNLSPTGEKQSTMCRNLRTLSMKKAHRFSTESRMPEGGQREGRGREVSS